MDHHPLRFEMVVIDIQNDAAYAIHPGHFFHHRITCLQDRSHEGRDRGPAFEIAVGGCPVVEDEEAVFFRMELIKAELVLCPEKDEDGACDTDRETENIDKGKSFEPV